MFVWTGQLREMVLSPLPPSFPPFPAAPPNSPLGGEQDSTHNLKVKGRWFQLQLAIFTCRFRIIDDKG